MVDTITLADLSDALPDVSSTLTVESIDSDITIYRDTKGIPHIKPLRHMMRFLDKV